MTVTPLPAAGAELPRNRKSVMRGLRIAHKTVDTGVDIIVILILLIGLYFLADTIWVYMHSRADVTMPYKPTDGDMSILKELSEDCIGWITLDDTRIDYPIMQGRKNMEYLNKDPYGNYSLSGSIFLDSRNTSDFSDDYSILYGHHVSGGYMFGALDEFEDPKYFDQHATGTLYTERGILPVQIVSFLYTDASNDLVFDPESKSDEVLKFAKDMAINYRKTTGYEVVALTTCKSPTSTRRACLFVQITDEGKDSDKGVTLEELQELSDGAQTPKAEEDDT